VPATKIPDGEYHTYDLGAHKLTPQMYIWVAPVENKDNVQAIWIDRMWLLRE